MCEKRDDVCVCDQTRTDFKSLNNRHFITNEK